MSPDHSARHYGIDADRMLDKVLDLPGQMEAAWALSEPFSTCIPGREAPLIICGMGGSAIGGELLRDLVSVAAPVAVHVIRGYRLPSFAGPDTPVICISYSGNTEETVGCFGDALARGCPTAVITSGGELAAAATEARIPLFEIPGGLPPRAAIGWLFTPLLRFAACRGLCEIDDAGFRSVLRKTRKLLAKCTLDADLSGNTPLQLAKRVYGKIPLIYCANGLLPGAAYRWKCQFNENSKSMAFLGIFPEIGHNEIMGWDGPGKILQELFLILLTDADDHPGVRRRMEVTYDMLEPLAAGAIKLNSVGGGGFDGRLARLLSIVALGDLTSVYLSVEAGRDPTPIERIESVKKLLRTEDR